MSSQLDKLNEELQAQKELCRTQKSLIKRYANELKSKEEQIRSVRNTKLKDGEELDNYKYRVVTLLVGVVRVFSPQIPVHKYYLNFVCFKVYCELMIRELPKAKNDSNATCSFYKEFRILWEELSILHQVNKAVSRMEFFFQTIVGSWCTFFCWSLYSSFIL
ncbi:unnamed protein product [Ambrosiozyma monospora]|uniref:Unnamed protein product n=1 Tax=Ambrosiozyma monospora TaxID=43982 RepID=A0ACB5T2S9_AMBMO|nr:unnamed protein product [Ambrosiozyma monospora]